LYNIFVLFTKLRYWQLAYKYISAKEKLKSLSYRCMNLGIYIYLCSVIATNHAKYIINT